MASNPAPINAGGEDSSPEQRTPAEVAALLRRPFHPSAIKQRQIAGRNIDYVPVADVIDRLNRAAPEWNWAVTDIRLITMPIRRQGALVDAPVVHVTGELTIPGLGARQGIGTAPAEGSEDAGKIAESDAIKRAATMFGVPGGR